MCKRDRSFYSTWWVRSVKCVCMHTPTAKISTFSSYSYSKHASSWHTISCPQQVSQSNAHTSNLALKSLNFWLLIVLIGLVYTARLACAPASASAYSATTVLPADVCAATNTCDACFKSRGGAGIQQQPYLQNMYHLKPKQQQQPQQLCLKCLDASECIQKFER